jgi:hypothetical protein
MPQLKIMTRQIGEHWPTCQQYYVLAETFELSQVSSATADET